MRTSETTGEIFAALVQANLLIVNPKKTSKVNAGPKKYAFAPLPELLDEIRPILQSYGLAFLQEAIDDGNGRVGAASMLVHISGEWITFDPLMLPAGNSPQDAGSAVTYSRRYTLCAALGISADDDTDGAQSAPRKVSSASAQAGDRPQQEVREAPPAAASDVKGGSAELESADGSPFATSTEEAGLWASLVEITGTPVRALARLNAVMPSGGRFTKADLPEANAEQLMAALEKLEANA